MIIKNMASAPNITYKYVNHMFVMMQPEAATRAQRLASNMHPTPHVPPTSDPRLDLITYLLFPLWGDRTDDLASHGTLLALPDGVI